MGEGDNRSLDATHQALNNPLLADIAIENAKGVLINITAGKDFRIDELGDIVTEVAKKTGDEGDMINGLIVDEKMEGKVKVTVIATGLDTPGTTQYEREIIIHDKVDDSEDIGKTLRRIRDTDSLSLHKEPEPETKDFPGKQMEIPAFLRKFSN